MALVVAAVSAMVVAGRFGGGGGDSGCSCGNRDGGGDISSGVYDGGIDSDDIGGGDGVTTVMASKVAERAWCWQWKIAIVVTT